jgi:hypothetical protein
MLAIMKKGKKSNHDVVRRDAKLPVPASGITEIY